MAYRNSQTDLYNEDAYHAAMAALGRSLWLRDWLALTVLRNPVIPASDAGEVTVLQARPMRDDAATLELRLDDGSTFAIQIRETTED
jgi:hypothetical protein